MQTVDSNNNKHNGATNWTSIDFEMRAFHALCTRAQWKDEKGSWRRNEWNEEKEEEDVFAYTQKIIPDACDFSASRKIANEAFHSNRFLLLLNDHYYDGFSPLPTRFPLIKTKLISESTRIVFV